MQMKEKGIGSNQNTSAMQKRKAPLKEMTPRMREHCASILTENSCVYGTRHRYAIDALLSSMEISGPAPEKHLLGMIADYVPEHRFLLAGPGDISPKFKKEHYSYFYKEECRPGSNEAFKYWERFEVGKHLAVERRGDDFFYYKSYNGEWLLHRDHDRPAIVAHYGSLLYMQKGKLHRELDLGPALVLPERDDHADACLRDYRLGIYPKVALICTKDTFAAISFLSKLEPEFEGQRSFYFINHERQNTPGLGSLYSAYAERTKRKMEDAKIVKRQRARKAMRLHQE